MAEIPRRATSIYHRAELSSGASRTLGEWREVSDNQPWMSIFSTPSELISDINTTVFFFSFEHVLHLKMNVNGSAKIPLVKICQSWETPTYHMSLSAERIRNQHHRLAGQLRPSPGSDPHTWGTAIPEFLSVWDLEIRVALHMKSIHICFPRGNN